MINRTTLILNNFIFILLFSILPAQPTYEFEIISIPDLEIPLGMNSDGEKIVGTNFGGMAVYWSDSTGSLILGPGEAWGISENERIFAELENSDGNWEAALVENEEITFLGNIEGGNTCDAFYSHGLGMSSDGLTGVGMGWINCGTSAFYWTDEDGIVELGQYEGNSTKAQAVSGDGQMIGGWAQTSNRASCLWDRDGNITLLGSLQVGNDYGEVHVISQDGTQVGGYCAGSAGNNVEGYIWTAEEGMTGLGVPANSAATNVSRVFDLSENNVAVGEYLNETPVFYKACIYTEETGEFVNLREYLLNLGMEEIEGWDLHRALCVSDDGNTIAGYGKDPSNNWTGWRIRIIESEAPAEILLVPSEYSTIQNAINASDNGDTVLVAPGTYIENINYSGKNIVIGSYFLTYGFDYFIEQTVIDSDSSGSVVTFENGEDSSAVLIGFRIMSSFANSPLKCIGSSPTLSHLSVRNNMFYSGSEAGIHLFNSNSKLDNLYIADNVKNSTGYGGAGIWVENSSISISNSLIVNNSTEHMGSPTGAGGIEVTNSHLFFDGNTMYNNYGGAILFKDGAIGTVINSIFWENDITLMEYGSMELSTLNVNFSDIQGGWDGEGNIDADPLFCLSDSTDFTLAENSPCVSAGENGADMGALSIGCDAILSINNNVLPFHFNLYQNYPNPFNPVTTIRFDLPEDTMVNVTVYDMIGRVVKTLLNGQHTAGYKSIQWNASNNRDQTVSAGLYLYKIQAGEFRQTKKMVLLK